MKYILYVLVFSNQHGLELKRFEIDGATITRIPVTREVSSLLGKDVVLKNIPGHHLVSQTAVDGFSFVASEMVASKDGRHLVISNVYRDSERSMALIDWEEGSFRSLPNAHSDLQSLTVNARGVRFIQCNTVFEGEHEKNNLHVQSITLDETGTKWQERPLKLPKPPVPLQWNERLAELLPALDAQDAIGAIFFDSFEQYSNLEPWTTYDYLSIDASLAMVEYRQSGNSSMAHRLGVATYESGWALKHLGNWTWIVHKEIHGDLVFVLGKRYDTAPATLSIIRHTDGKLIAELRASGFCLAGHGEYSEYLRYQEISDGPSATRSGGMKEVSRSSANVPTCTYCEHGPRQESGGSFESAVSNMPNHGCPIHTFGQPCHPSLAHH